VGPWAGLDWCRKSRPTGIRSPDRPARRQSLYRLRYPALFRFFHGNLNISYDFLLLDLNCVLVYDIKLGPFCDSSNSSVKRLEPEFYI